MQDEYLSTEKYTHFFYENGMYNIGDANAKEKALFVENIQKKLMGDTKQKIRKIFKKHVQEMSDEQKLLESARVCDLIENSELFEAAKGVMMYMPQENCEVNIFPLAKLALNSGKRVAFASVASVNDCTMVPIEVFGVEEEDFKIGAYNILEPKSEKLVEDLNDEWIVVCPGVAFDEEGNRMGKGKGFYDRFIQKFRNGNSIPLFLGVCFENQFVKQVICSDFDEKMDYVIHPSLDKIAFND